jgi:hypothetical protein
MIQELISDSIDAYMQQGHTKPAPRPIDGSKVGRQYADALDVLKAADAKMRRAFHVYERAQKQVRRLEKLLDRAERQS